MSGQKNLKSQEEFLYIIERSDYMLPTYFTFEDFKKENNLTIATREIKLQVRCMYSRGTYAIPAYKKQRTYFQIVKKEEVEKWLEEPAKSYPGGHKECNNYKDIMKQYGLEKMTTTKKDFIHFMEGRGIQVQVDDTISPTQFKVIDDEKFNYNWVPYVNDNHYEVCKEGFVRSAETKRLCGSSSKRDQYVIINNSYNDKGQYSAHRMVKETFDPIPNASSFVVDHINGIRTDNRLENLRWCYQSQNIAYKEENLEKIKELIPKCIQKYGYKEFENILANLL